MKKGTKDGKSAGIKESGPGNPGPMPETGNPKHSDPGQNPGANAAASAEAKPAVTGPKPETQNPKHEPPDPAQAEMAALLKEIESAMFSIRFHPVAVTEKSKDEALSKLEGIYSKGNETVRQMLMYMVHEYLATSMELKTMHTLEYFKMKNAGQDAAQQRMSVYRAMFNYNTSLEGIFEMVKFLGRLRGSDDAVKLLTYHYSHLSFIENEASHVLRASILDALGKAESKYALLALLDYAEYTDNERSFGRIVSALLEWEEKLDSLRMPEKEKAGIRDKLKKIVTSEFGGSHYG
ncbi:hypothetical protein L0Y65_03640 [Candidatus Micrarchaeota archaeon]|nr:hypothetical protein [Candidatus Micrarchaeota archaeon]